MSPLWTQSQIDYLHAHYKTTSCEEIGAYLNKSPTAVRVKANRIGLKKPPVETMGMTKETRYRLKNISNGRCPRCWKPCAPFYLCDKHREEERLRGVEGRPRKFKAKPRRKMYTKTGIITRVGHVTTHRLMG